MAAVEMWFARWPWVWFPACSPHLLQGQSQLFFAQTGLPSLTEEPSLSKQATESLEDAQPTTQAPENVCLGPVSTMLAFQGCFLHYSGRGANFHSVLSTQPALLNSGESEEVLVPQKANRSCTDIQGFQQVDSERKNKIGGVEDEIRCCQRRMGLLGSPSKRCCAVQGFQDV